MSGVYVFSWEIRPRYQTRTLGETDLQGRRQRVNTEAPCWLITLVHQHVGQKTEDQNKAEF